MSVLTESIEMINEDTNSKFKVSRNRYYINVLYSEKINGVDVSIDTNYKKDSKISDEEIISGINTEAFEKAFKIFKSNFPKIKSTIESYIKDQVASWDQDYNSLKKYIIMDLISYTRFEKEADSVDSFEIYYNNTSHNGDRNKVLGGHTIIAEVRIKNGKLKMPNSISLEG